MTEIVPVRADRPGTLPSDGASDVLDVRLPPGRQVVSGSALPVAWLSDQSTEYVGEMIALLQERFDRTGLWPISVFGDGVEAWFGSPGGDEQTDPGTVDVEALLAATYEREVNGVDPDFLPPFGVNFPGLAAPATGRSLHSLGRPIKRPAARLALISCQRPSDAVLRIGWTGARNYYDSGELTAILRGLEDRFGAVLTDLGPDMMFLMPDRLPGSDAEVQALAGELIAVAPDELFQEVGDYDEFSERLGRARPWRLWWD